MSGQRALYVLMRNQRVVRGDAHTPDPQARPRFTPLTPYIGVAPALMAQQVGRRRLQGGCASRSLAPSSPPATGRSQFVATGLLHWGRPRIHGVDPVSVGYSHIGGRRFTLNPGAAMLHVYCRGNRGGFNGSCLQAQWRRFPGHLARHRGRPARGAHRSAHGPVPPGERQGRHGGRNERAPCAGVGPWPAATPATPVLSPVTAPRSPFSCTRSNRRCGRRPRTPSIRGSAPPSGAIALDGPGQRATPPGFPVG